MIKQYKLGNAVFTRVENSLTGMYSRKTDKGGTIYASEEELKLYGATPIESEPRLTDEQEKRLNNLELLDVGADLYVPIIQIVGRDNLNKIKAHLAKELQLQRREIRDDIANVLSSDLDHLSTSEIKDVILSLQVLQKGI